MKKTDKSDDGSPWRKEHRLALQMVAAALRMTVDEFLADDTCAPTELQARNYLHAFAVQAEETQVLTAFYLIRAITRGKEGAAIRD